MKIIKLFYNTRKDPIRTIKSEGGEIMKHQIASLILLTMDEYRPHLIHVAIDILHNLRHLVCHCGICCFETGMAELPIPAGNILPASNS